MKARMVFVAFLLLSTPVGSQAAESAPYKEVLLTALDLRDQVLRSSGRAPLGSPTLREAIVAANPDVLATLSPHLPPVAELRAQLQTTQAHLDAARNEALQKKPRTSNAKDIVFPEPDPISDCTDASPSTAHAMLEAWSVSKGILAAAKWACLQTVLGENGAEFCTALAIETEALETEYELESFCLGAQRDATMAAMAETQQSVADFLNERGDVTVSSRASQTSVDSLQLTLNALLMRLSALRTTLIEDDNGVTQSLADLLDDAMGLATQLVALSADIHDVRFRTQAVQVDVEDVQQRLADVQTQATRLAGDSEQLRSTLLRIQSALSTAQSALQTAAREQRDRRLAAALGDADSVIIRYRLPVANGGELERSREVLIRALSAFEALGADTSAARNLLIVGDSAYNQGRALDAYDAFARAYRLLLAAPTTNPPTATPNLIARDSFE